MHAHTCIKLVILFAFGGSSGTGTKEEQDISPRLLCKTIQASKVWRFDDMCEIDKQQQMTGNQQRFDFKLWRPAVRSWKSSLSRKC